jgi:uncharacterized protein (TIRG00374 family)
VADIFTVLGAADKTLMLIVFLLPFIGYFISANRWKILLKAQNVDSSIFFLIKSYMVSTFFNNFMPSTIGGDTIRAYDSWRLGKNKIEAILVVSTDRILGILALMIFALSAILASHKTVKNFPLYYMWVPLMTIGVVILLYILLISNWRIYQKIKFPIFNKLNKIIDQIENVFLSYQDRKDTLLIGFVLSMLLQTNVIIHYYLIAKSLDIPISLINFFVIIPLALFVMMIPITVNAIGVRENIFVFFFTPFGVPESKAIAFSWLAYGIIIVHGIIGGVVFAVRNRVD